MDDIIELYGKIPLKEWRDKMMVALMVKHRCEPMAINKLREIEKSLRIKNF